MKAAIKAIALFLFLGSAANAQYDPKDYNLAPGEILVAVNGVPVNQLQASPIRSTIAAVVNTVSAVSSRVVNRDQAAYNHALREAQILAARRASGHPLGVAPGCSFAGTGTSNSPNVPNHCYKNVSESRLVARAVVLGSDGMYYWSAHYR